MRIGILGAGQLGRMLALAGYPLGFNFRFFDSNQDSPAKPLGEFYHGMFEDKEALRAFCAGLDVVTYEFENIPVDAVRFIESLLPVFPSAESISIAQDRANEKQIFDQLNIPTTKWLRIEKGETPAHKNEKLILPGVLKQTRLGYDGKGQTIIRTNDAIELHQSLKSAHILEELINFDFECSIIACRSRTGVVKFYPLTENIHKEGILHISYCPSRDAVAQLQQTAEEYCLRLLNQLNHIGVLTVEFFVRNNQLFANEIAPRVHNSGHWTINGAETSQFENHLRAITDLPLGSTAPLGFEGMVNIIGREPIKEDLLRIDGAHLHLYNKEPRDKRKIGHINVNAVTAEQRDDLLSNILKCL